MLIRRIIDSVVLFLRLLKANFQIMSGIWKISKLPKPRVTIFGGHLIQLDSVYAQKAHQLAYELSQDSISVITGGGPGIMEAANCGASHINLKKIKARSIGINVRGLEPVTQQSLCVQESIITDYFFARKWLLMQYSDAFVFFPGGFGTLDEFGEMMTLIQTKQLPRMPLILIGKEYWQPLITWFSDTALKNKLISTDDLSVITVTDDIEEVLRLLKVHCINC